MYTTLKLIKVNSQRSFRRFHSALAFGLSASDRPPLPSFLQSIWFYNTYSDGIYLGVRTCEVFLCFVAFVRVRVYYVDFFVFFVLRHWWVSQVLTPRQSRVTSGTSISWSRDPAITSQAVKLFVASSPASKRCLRRDSSVWVSHSNAAFCRFLAFSLWRASKFTNYVGG